MIIQSGSRSVVCQTSMWHVLSTSTQDSLLFFLGFGTIFLLGERRAVHLAGRVASADVFRQRSRLLYVTALLVPTKCDQHDLVFRVRGIFGYDFCKVCTVLHGTIVTRDNVVNLLVGFVVDDDDDDEDDVDCCLAAAAVAAASVLLL